MTVSVPPVVSRNTKIQSFNTIGSIRKVKFTLPFKLAVFALLSLLSIAAHHGIERYHAVGGELLANNDFASGFEGWQITSPEKKDVSVDRGEVKIQSGNSTASPQIAQRLPASLLGSTVGFKATVKTVDISPGEKAWHAGRILFVQYRQGQALYSTSHGLAFLLGTDDWKTYTAFFHIQPEVSEARVIVVLNRVTGELYCRDLSLFTVAANPVYTLVKWALMGGWFLFTLALFAPVLAKAHGSGWIRPALMVLTVAGIIVGTTMPGSLKNDLKADVIEEVKSYSEAMSIPVISTTKKLVRKFTTSYSIIDITKWAHFGLFGLLTFLLCWQASPAKPLLILTDMLMLACGTELVQLFIENRGSHLSDVAVDMAGSTAGLMLWLAARRYARRRAAGQGSSAAGA